MFYDRSSQILLLKKEFPKLKPVGSRPTIFTISLSSFFGRSSCVLEITIPKDYPIGTVSFRMINPIPHHWAVGDIIKCPRHLYDKPLVDMVWEVVSMFVDYDKYVSGNRLHEDDKDSEKKLVESFTKLKEEIVHALNNPPQSSLPQINSLSEDRIKTCLQYDSEIYKLIYKCDNLNKVVKSCKKRLDVNEQSISNSIRNTRRCNNIFSDLENNVKYIDNISTSSPSNFITDIRNTTLKILKRDIISLKNKVNRRKESIRSGRKTYKELKDEIFRILNKINSLTVLYLSIDNDHNQP